MANIISKIGASIAKNRIEVKAILDKHNIPAGTSNADRIRAAFTAIKAGDTSLATELAALSSKSSFKIKLKNDLDKIKARVAAVKTKIAATPKSKADSHSIEVKSSNQAVVVNADGTVDPIAVDSTELIDAVSKTDIEASVKEASTSAKEADLSDTRTMMALGLVFIVIAIAVIDPMKYFKSK